MIRKWAKLLPYWIVMWFTKKFGGSTNTFNGKYVISWRIDKGEFIVWNQENYNIMRKREREDKEKKKSKRQRKFEKLKEEFEPEPEEEELEE